MKGDGDCASNRKRVAIGVAPMGTIAIGIVPMGVISWLNLEPQFKTDRSGLGIHNCNPGSGCLCIPNRNDLNVLANWVEATGIKKLRIVD